MSLSLQHVVAGRRGRKRQAVIHLELPEGHHGLLIDDREVAQDLLEVIGGVRTPRRGKVLLDGVQPCRSPASRQRVGTLLPDEPQDFLGTTVRSHLQALGAEPIDSLFSPNQLDLSPRDLDVEGRRRLALNAALAAPDRHLLALFEPQTCLAPPALDDLYRRLANSHGIVVIVGTTRRALRPFADRVTDLRDHASPATTEPRLSLRVERPRQVAQLMLSSEDVSGVAVDPQRSQYLLAYGPDGQALAACALRAVQTAQCELFEMTQRGYFEQAAPGARGFAWHDNAEPRPENGERKP